MHESLSSEPNFKLSPEVIEFIDSRLTELAGESIHALQAQIDYGSNPELTLQKLIEHFEASCDEYFNYDLQGRLQINEKRCDSFTSAFYKLARYKPEITHAVITRLVTDMEAGGNHVPVALYGGLALSYEDHLARSGFEADDDIESVELPASAVVIVSLSRTAVNEYVQTSGRAHKYADKILDYLDIVDAARVSEFTSSMLIDALLITKPSFLCDRLESGTLTEDFQLILAAQLLSNPCHQYLAKRDQIIARIDDNLFSKDFYYPHLVYNCVLAGKSLTSEQRTRLKNIAIQDYGSSKPYLRKWQIFDCLPASDILEVISANPKFNYSSKYKIIERLISENYFAEAINFAHEQLNTQDFMGSLINMYEATGDRRFISNSMLETALDRDAVNRSLRIVKVAGNYGHRDIINSGIDRLEHFLKMSIHPGAILNGLFEHCLERDDVSQAEAYFERILKVDLALGIRNSALKFMEFYMDKGMRHKAEELFFRVFDQPTDTWHVLSAIEILATGKLDR